MDKSIRGGELFLTVLLNPVSSSARGISVWVSQLIHMMWERTGSQGGFSVITHCSVDISSVWLKRCEKGGQGSQWLLKVALLYSLLTKKY